MSILVHCTMASVFRKSNEITSETRTDRFATLTDRAREARELLGRCTQGAAANLLGKISATKWNPTSSLHGSETDAANELENLTALRWCGTSRLLCAGFLSAQREYRRHDCARLRRSSKFGPQFSRPNLGSQRSQIFQSISRLAAQTSR